MRTFTEPIPVTIRTGRNGQPIVMARAGSREQVKTVNIWIETGAWWDGRKPRTYYKLLCRKSLRVVVVFHEENGGWYLARVMD